MGILNFLIGKRRAQIQETQKQLPALPPVTVGCGLCNVRIEPDYLFSHWEKAHTTAINDDSKMAGHGGPLRSASKQRTMVFIVRRAVYNEDVSSRLNAELITEQYFARAIISLKQQRPEMRFQYVPACMGESGKYLKTLLVIGEWDEE